MKKIKIVSDSSSDILSLEKVEFDLAPLKIITEDREFVDNRDLDVLEMVNFLEQYKGKIKSACPSTGEWIDAFGDADDIICVTISSNMSGSYNSACVAKKIYEEENSGKRVFVLDTLNAGPGIGLIVHKLEEYISSGLEFEEVVEKIQEYTKNIGLFFMLKSLKNFANNGRVSPVLAKIIGFLGICIVAKASDDGVIESIAKIRGETRSLDKMLEQMKNIGYKTGRILIGHCKNEKGANAMKDLIIKEFGEVDITIYEMRGLCSMYAETGGILIGYEKGE